TTQGNWTGQYGASGYQLAAADTSVPGFATVSVANKSDYTWAASTTDPRALRRPNSTNRVAATWYSAAPFTITVASSDSQAHQIALYLLDWDNASRAETIQVLASPTQAVL